MKIKSIQLSSLIFVSLILIGRITGQIQPKFNLSTPVTGADSYQIIVVSDVDEANQLWKSDEISSFPVTYPSSAPALDYGTVYYAKIIAFKDGNIHGIPGKLILIQTPNITRPVILDGPLFTWGGTEPSSSTYEVSVSPVEDMSNIVWSSSASGTNISKPDGEFKWGATFYWQVQGLDSDGNPFGEPSETGFFQTSSVEPPTLNSPNGDKLESLIPSFSWSSVSQASKYMISVGSDEELSSPVWGETVTDLSIAYPSEAMILSRGTTYFWQVIPLDAEGTPFGSGVKSEVGNFQTPDPIQPPTLNSPVGEEIPGLVPSFSWSGVEGITEYSVKLSKDEEFSNVVWSVSVGQTNVSYPDDAIKLDFGASYFWNVSPLNKNNEPYADAMSSTGNFTTSSLAPIELLGPVNTSIESTIPMFKWSASDNASSYRIDVSESEDLGDLLVSELVSGTEYNSFVGSNDKTYYWRVIPVDAGGVELVNRSVVVMFNTPGLNELSLTSPMNTTISNVTPTLKWGTLDGASGYFVSISIEGNNVWSDLMDGNEIIYPGSPALNYETTYTWSVQAVDESGNPISSNTESSFTTAPYTKVELSSPLNEEVGVMNVQFSWGEVEGSSGYLTEISSNDDMSGAWRTTVSMTNLTYPDDPPFQSGKSYYWRVITVDQDGNPQGEWSDVATFQITEPPPVILSDPSGDISTSNPSFSWSEIEGASGYKIHVSSSEDFSDGWESTSGVTSLQYSGDALEPNIPYFWKAVVIDQNGNLAGLWSEVASFQLTAVFTVTLISPINEEIYSQNPQFSWEGVEGIGKYEISISSNDDMSNIIWLNSEIQDAGTQYPSAGVDQLSFGKTYYWHVRSLDMDGNAISDPSVSASFTLSGDLTSELLVPVDTQVENLYPVFSWSEVSGAGKYSILVASSDDFSEVVYQNDNIDGTAISYPTSGAADLEFETTYFWRIQALSSDGLSLGDSSPVGMFMTPSGEIEIIVEFGD